MCGEIKLCVSDVELNVTETEALVTQYQSINQFY